MSTDDTTAIATAYTSARRHLEQAATMLAATPAREIARSAAQICRDLALEAIKDRPECDVEACNRAARSDAALLITTHVDALVELAKGERFARAAALAGALAELEGAIAELMAVAPTPEQAAASRAYRLDSRRASVVVAQARELEGDELELPRPRPDEGHRQAIERQAIEAGRKRDKRGRFTR